jgi:hypothetical protein
LGKFAIASFGFWDVIVAVGDGFSIPKFAEIVTLPGETEEPNLVVKVYSFSRLEPGGTYAMLRTFIDNALTVPVAQAGVAEFEASRLAKLKVIVRPRLRRSVASPLPLQTLITASTPLCPFT